MTGNTDDGAASSTVNSVSLTTVRPDISVTDASSAVIFS
jgi:hypothetical protein